ncbi:MAG: M16 family metallopeptidase [Candidatus Tyrphobacter sp.]
MRRALALLALTFSLAPALARAHVPVASNVSGVATIVQGDPSAALAGVEIAIPAGLDRERLNESGLAALTAATIERTPVDGVPLDEAIEAKGGSVRFAVDPSDVRFYVEALAANANAVVALFARALAAPDFSVVTMDRARRHLVREIAAQQSEPLSVGIQMLDLARASGNNVGLPSFGTPASLASLGPNGAAAFYRAYYRRGGATLSLVGRTDAIDAQTLASVVRPLAPGRSSVVDTGLRPLAASGRHELVARRGVSAPWLVVSFGAPSVKSADYGPMLVLDAFLERTLGDIVQVPGTIEPSASSQAVGALYDFGATQPALVMYVDGGVGEPDRTFGTALSVVNILAQTRLQGSIDGFKRIAASNFLIGAQTLEERARLAAMFVRDTGSPDYLGATLRAIHATTPADLQRVARRYLTRPTIALVLPRATS